jgi:hypothetical protein
MVTSPTSLTGTWTVGPASPDTSMMAGMKCVSAASDRSMAGPIRSSALQNRVSRPTTPTRAGRLADASVDPTEAS